MAFFDLPEWASLQTDIKERPDLHKECEKCNGKGYIIV